MYQKVSPDMNFVDREKNVGKFWRNQQIFEKSMKAREGKPVYTFYDGPPTANGKPHIGHVLTRVIKDMIPRYKTMKGYMVPRKAGWDTHGLPVELEVEKMLGLDGKEQIEEYGMEPFIKKCKESVWKYKGMWEDFSGTVGFWADMENPYVIRALRSCLIVQDVVHHFPHRRLPRAISSSRSVLRSFVLRLLERMLISWHGPRLHGHCRLTWLSV